ncbi:MAG: type II toxin-antitoxin system HicB family antitoxin [Firmicutes bacterium]|nr:type II toxin-antitoxin system HicB family antitoxin [Bacillota bacterium]
MNNPLFTVYNKIRGVVFMKRTYTIAIHENKEELEEGHNVKKYWAQCIEIPGAITSGDTIEEIKENMKEAIELMLQPIPEELLKEEKSSDENVTY